MEAFAQFIPLILIGLLVVAFAWPMAKRKGLGVGAALSCIIPFIGFFVLVWIASKPDLELLKRIEKLEKETL